MVRVVLAFRNNCAITWPTILEHAPMTAFLKAHYLASYLYWAPNERDLKQLEKGKESKIGLFAP